MRKYYRDPTEDWREIFENELVPAVEDRKEARNRVYHKLILCGMSPAEAHRLSLSSVETLLSRLTELHKEI